MPAQRPDRTLIRQAPRHRLRQFEFDGDDGAPLTDYDLIGSLSGSQRRICARSRSVLQFLCIPPLSRDRDVGPSALLVAARCCKERRALLIVDPPSNWQTADDVPGRPAGLGLSE
jgi:hypothetical protein